LHLDYGPDHVLVSNDQAVVIDWGEASVGDSALGEYFVDCYQKVAGRRLPNLEYFKQAVALKMVYWCGLRPFHGSTLRNYARLFLMYFGDVLGEVKRSRYVKEMRGFMKGHHTSVWCDIEYILNYALDYLENPP